MNTSIYAFFGDIISTGPRLDNLAKAGFSGVGVWINEDPHFATIEDERQMLMAVKTSGLKIAYALAPKEYSAYLGYELYGVGEAKAKFKNYVNTANEYEISLLTIEVKEITDALIDNLTDLVLYAADRKVTIAVENNLSTTIDGFDKLFAQIEGLAFAYNPVNEIIMGYNQGELLDRFGARLAIVKLCNSGIDQPSRNAISSEGAVDFSTVASKLKSCGYKGYLNIECFEAFADEKEGLTAELRALEKYFNEL